MIKGEIMKIDNIKYHDHLLGFEIQLEDCTDFNVQFEECLDVLSADYERFFISIDGCNDHQDRSHDEIMDILHAEENAHWKALLDKHASELSGEIQYMCVHTGSVDAKDGWICGEFTEDDFNKGLENKDIVGVRFCSFENRWLDLQ
jgi:hypothetical protein